jgi:hypothetical protein
MTLLVFLLSAACPPTKMINQSKLAWVDYDREEMKYCQKRCPVEYKSAVCLKKFYKLGYQDYFCLCGSP